MNTPQLIVIGAQKCGTTTLYEDLAQHPAITLTEKESAVLLEHPTAQAAREAYAQHPVADGQVLVEVATEYAMRPAHEVAARAHGVAPETLIIYIVRDPYRRTISHHHHEVAARTMGADIDQAVRDHPRLVDYSRYAYQIRPWIEAFGADRVHVIRFEDYMGDRTTGAMSIHRLLGLPPTPLDDPQTKHNVATKKRVAVGLGGRIARNPVYRRLIRPYLGDPVKNAVKTLLLPKAPPRPGAPSHATTLHLVERLTPEIHELAELLGTDPWWDLSVHTQQNG